MKFKDGKIFSAYVRSKLHSGYITYIYNIYWQTFRKTSNVFIEALKCHIGNAHIHAHIKIALHCLCKVESSITKIRSGGQILNFEKSLMKSK